MRIVLLFVFIGFLFAGCTNKQQEMEEKLQADLDRITQEAKKKAEEREKLFTGGFNKDVGAVTYDSKTGKHISGKNPYKEFLKFVDQNPKVANVKITFDLSFRGKDQQTITIDFTRIHLWVDVESSLGASKTNYFETEEAMKKWASELAGYNSSLWLGLD